MDVDKARERLDELENAFLMELNDSRPSVAVAIARSALDEVERLRKKVESVALYLERWDDRPTRVPIAAKHLRDALLDPDGPDNKEGS